MRITSKITLAMGLVFAVTILSTWIIGCKSSHVGKEDLLKYVQDKEHGLVHKITSNGIGMRVSYHPKELLVLQELRGNNKLNEKQLEAARKKYSGQEYFMMGLSRNDKEVIRELGSFDRYSDMLQVLSFQMADKITLVSENKDTIPIKDYVFQQTYGMSSENTLLFVFDASKLNKASTWTMHVNEFGLGTGNQKFVFRRHDVERMPALKELVLQ
jgi:hypothetical protein